MAQTKVILREDVRKLGEAGDVVSVKPGFARNFLLPKGIAIVATDARVKELEHNKRQIAEKVAKERKSLEFEKARIEQLHLEVEAQAGEGGKLFGSVTAMQIAELLGEKGVEVDRRKIDLPEPIKEVGDHSVSIKLKGDIVATVSLKVSVAE
ncbi:MAG: 50S ribosomal protein L9 [Myxococcota bacterium]|nr:50S ribosomal protein L9 [Myxococcota bacterium]